MCIAPAAEIDGFDAGDADAEALAGLAIAEPDSQEAASAQLFAKLVANYAGDLATAFFSTGGVTLSGKLLRSSRRSSSIPRSGSPSSAARRSSRCCSGSPCASP